MRILFFSLVALTISLSSAAQLHEAVDVNLVEVYVSALHQNEIPDVDLKKEDFDLSVDGKKQEITHFSHLIDPESQIPLSIALMIDTSGSMSLEEDQRKKIDIARDLALQILKEVKTHDKIQLLRFDTVLRSLTSLTSNASEVSDALSKVDVNAKADPGTALLYFLASMAGHMVKFPGRRILILFSDGVNTMAGPSKDAVIHMLQKADVTVVSVGINDSSPFHSVDPEGGQVVAPSFGTEGPSPRSLPNIKWPTVSTMQRGRILLSDLADKTGGYAFFAKDFSNPDYWLENVSSVIRSQYMLGFLSKESGHPWQKIEVKCKQKGVKLRYRAVYFSG